MNVLPFRQLDYQPEPQVLKARFRIWHVESLLNQAADLIDTCLEEFREYSSLDTSWNQFQLELTAQTDELRLDENREDYFERDYLMWFHKKFFLQDSILNFSHLMNAVLNLHNYPYRQNRQDESLRNKQNFYEKEIEKQARNLEQMLTDLQFRWAESDKLATQEKFEVRKRVINEKTILSQGTNAFAFERFRDLVWERLERNYKDALNRACVAEEGLKQIYGFLGPDYGPTPPLKALPPPGIPWQAKLTLLTIWVRSSIEWLAAFNQLDQAFTKCISIKAFVGEDVWRSLQASVDSFRLTIKIPGSYFKNHDQVRLRGLSMRIVGRAGVIPWSVIVKLPQKAVYQRNTDYVAIDQSDLPPCTLGRVENTNSTRQIEVCGLISLINASPIGNSNEVEQAWSFEVIRPDGDLENFSEIDDLLLEINAVGIPLNIT
jgi:hypothetical protein